jgi:YhcH/YjgK/YiaL family protein
MIYDSIDNLKDYIPMMPQLVTVIEVLANEKLADKADGGYTTANPKVRYNIASYATIDQPKQFESHQAEIDVQIMLSGRETMQVASRSSARSEIPYDAQTDCSLFDCDATVSITADADHFAIFFTGEPHKPGLAHEGCAGIRKVIFKVGSDPGRPQ